MVNYRLVFLLVFFTTVQFATAQRVTLSKPGKACTISFAASSPAQQPTLVYDEESEQMCYENRVGRVKVGSINKYAMGLVNNIDSYTPISYSSILLKSNTGTLEVNKRYKITMQDGNLCYAVAISQNTLYKYVFIIESETDNCLVLVSRSYNLENDMIY